MRPEFVSVLMGILLVLLVATTSGCGDGDGLARVAVHGAVTLNGEPVPNGVIRFAPSAQTQGPIASAMITDGEYEIPQDQGPVAGEYEVRVQAYDDPNSNPVVPSGNDKLGPKNSSDNAGNSSPASNPEPVETKRTFNLLIPATSSFDKNFEL